MDEDFAETPDDSTMSEPSADDSPVKPKKTPKRQNNPVQRGKPKAKPSLNSTLKNLSIFEVELVCRILLNFVV